MPPKKGKKGKKGKEKSDASDGRKAGTPEPTDKETLLKEELDELSKQLEDTKKHVDELRKENEWLQQEATKVRIESHEYMSYMEKKTQKRQKTIISLSDQNQKEINDLEEEKRMMLEDFQQKKEALRAILTEKEHTLAKTRQQLDDLQEYKNLQNDQSERIKKLEREVITMRGKHSDAMQQLKTKFLKEKREFQQESDNKIATMGKQANKEATACLEDHTQRIKVENRKLRHELLVLIRKTRALHEHKKHLDEQRGQLLMEQQYAEDLKRLRTARQHKVFKSFGMLEKEQKEQTREEEKRALMGDN